MAGVDSTAILAAIQSLLRLVRDVARNSASGFAGEFKKDCTDLSRRVALLSHLLEEIRDFKGDFRLLDSSPSSSSSSSCLADITVALQAAKKLLTIAANFDHKISLDGAAQKIAFQFQCVTWKLEKALANLPYDHFDISEEVQEQVDLVRGQLRRARERYGRPLKSVVLSHGLLQPSEKELDRRGSLHVENTSNINHQEVETKVETAPKENLSKGYYQNEAIDQLESSKNSSASSETSLLRTADVDDGDNSSNKNVDENKKMDAPAIPVDFLCPISLELMRDPVIVSTGQTYERSYIQRWIDCGNTTCPKTQQKLQNVTLTPNYVLRSLITQWCINHNVEQPTSLTNRRLKRSDGSFRDVSEDIEAIEAIVRNLSSRSIEERRAAVSEIRSLSKRSTDNRILLAEAGAIPILVSLLTSEDNVTQENAVTSILNLSIYENNKGLIMLANVVPSIVQLLRVGSMATRENAAATLFSLSLANENKIIIGASGAIPALVNLLENGSVRGKKDAATALFNLCIYQRNKGRAVRAGIIGVLLKMLSDSTGCMVDEALTILSVLASHQEAKSAIVKASTIPLLIDLTRTGLPRNKENATSILLSLCKRDNENLACISRLGAVIPLMELVKNGSERAKRKAKSLLEHLGTI
ncbi:U-box domain-containing protein 11-like [Cynara cardunculus var. scolymus]|uniref:RING-type E3 ubiquitin transferase n=1 Tax=Cynara cardunculus var. scolymus TaxID=59895 RepID=A0A124SG65_CYNCS|nr:U-box domain-containing protein 11-like [Cynara cardunculus var. scolymus]KVI05417.1 Armadillo [Cynara cardunculus var. scolymus]